MQPLSTNELLQNLLGIETRPVESNPGVTIGTTAAKVLKSNPNRCAYTFTNLSANSMYIGLTEKVSSTHGIYIAPYGGQITVQWDKDFTQATYELWAIASVAGSAYYTQENIIT